MNVNGNTSYVSYKNLHDPYFKKTEFKFEDPLLARKYAFSPGNNIANFLACTRKTALIIGNNLFVHAGILPKIAKKYNVDDINYILSLYLFKELQNKNDYNDILNSPVNSPLWTRQFSQDPGKKTCDNILLPLKSVYKVDNMYVGHNPQLGNGIKSMCNDKVWLTDIGNSSAFKMFHTTESFKNIEILEILTDLDTNKQKFNILKGKK